MNRAAKFQASKFSSRRAGHRDLIGSALPVNIPLLPPSHPSGIEFVKTCPNRLPPILAGDNFAEP
jgi:hypothetical protein